MSERKRSISFLLGAGAAKIQCTRLVPERGIATTASRAASLHEARLPLLGRQTSPETGRGVKGNEQRVGLSKAPSPARGSPIPTHHPPALFVSAMEDRSAAITHALEACVSED